MAERVQIVTSELNQTPAGEYTRAGSANRLPLKARLAAIALTAPGMAVLLAACGSGSDSGKTFVSDDLTQTAQALNATPTSEGTKVIVVEITPTPTPKPTEVVPTPEPILQPQALADKVSEALKNVSDKASADSINRSIATGQKYLGNPDPNVAGAVTNSYGAAGKDFSKMACASNDQAMASAFIALKAFSVSLVKGYEDRGVYTKGSSVGYSQGFFSIPADCANEYLAVSK